MPPRVRRPPAEGRPVAGPCRRRHPPRARAHAAPAIASRPRIPRRIASRSPSMLKRPASARRRVPSAPRSRWRTQWIALTACRASARSSSPARAPSASSRAGTSSRPLACSVPAPPSWPKRAARSLADLLAAALPHDDAVRAHPQRLPHEAWRARFLPAPSRFACRASRATVRVPRPELRDILDGDDPVRGRRLAEQCRQECRPARAGGTGDEDVLWTVTISSSRARAAGVERAVVREIIERGRANRGMRRDTSVPAVAMGGSIGVDARTSTRAARRRTVSHRRCGVRRGR